MVDNPMKEFYQEEKDEMWKRRSFVTRDIDNVLNDLWCCDLSPDIRKHVEKKLVEAKMWIKREP